MQVNVDTGDDDETFHSLTKEGTDSTDRPPLLAARVSSRVPYNDLQSLVRIAEEQHAHSHRKESELAAEAQLIDAEDSKRCLKANSQTVQLSKEEDMNHVNEKLRSTCLEIRNLQVSVYMFVVDHTYFAYMIMVVLIVSNLCYHAALI